MVVLPLGCGVARKIMSAALVKELRERTGLGLLECKRALAEADGDIDAAIEGLRKSSGMKAAKKAGRTAADGVVAIQTADDGSFAAMVEVNRNAAATETPQSRLVIVTAGHMSSDEALGVVHAEHGAPGASRAGAGPA